MATVTETPTEDLEAPESATSIPSHVEVETSESDQQIAPLPKASLAHKVSMLSAIVLPFAGLIMGIVLAWQFGWMSWLYVGLLVGGWMLTGLGITIGFHRLLSHRSFETYGPIRAFWMAMGALAVQGSPLIWCAIHRRHHELSDKKGDPHSPLEHGNGWWNSLRGFLHAHMGWLFTDYWTTIDMEHYIPDLRKDRLLIAVDRLYYVWVLASLAIPAAIGGLVTATWLGALLGFIWGGLVRVFLVHHITWSINSVCHIFGKREYDAGDDSRNNVICGVLAQGEGWHNNHHAFPNSARHGLKWWQFDLSWIIIRTMRLCRLAWNIKLPTERQLAEKRLSS